MSLLGLKRGSYTPVMKDEDPSKDCTDVWYPSPEVQICSQHQKVNPRGSKG